MDDIVSGALDSRSGLTLSPSDIDLAGPISHQRGAASLLREPVVVISAIVLIAWVILGVTSPILPLADPNEVLIEQKLAAPSAENLFGTDELGRDVLSRVAHAARISLPAGLIVVILSVLIGSTVGAIAGQAGGLVDQSIMRLCDAVLSFPTIILAMAIATIRGGPGIDNVVLAVVLVLWPEYARLMRGQVLHLKHRDFVLAARSMGATAPRIYLRHIVPSANAPIVVKATLGRWRRNPADGKSEFSRFRRHPADLGMGCNGQSGIAGGPAILVGVGLSGAGDRFGRDGAQFPR